MLNRIREYRWELWLLFGLPVATAIAAWILALLIYSALDAGGAAQVYLPVGALTLLAFLAASYCRVRRLERPILRLVWQYSLAIGALGAALSLVIFLRYETSSGSLVERFIDILWTGLLYGLFYLIFLVWFARKASRYGFDKALVLMGVAVSPGLVFAGNPIDHPEYYAVALVMGAILTFIPVWALRMADSGRIAGKGSLAVLFAAALVLQAFAYLSPSSDWWLWRAASLVMFVIFPYGLAVALAYLFRVKDVERIPETRPQPPDKPDEDEEKTPEFVGFYTRKRDDGEG